MMLEIRVLIEYLFIVIFKPKWLRFHHKLARLYEDCSAELMTEPNQKLDPKDVLSLLIERKVGLSLFESLERAEQIQNDFRNAK